MSVVITSVEYPDVVLPGAPTEMTVTVQFTKALGKFFIRGRDMVTGGIAFTTGCLIGSFGVGSTQSRTLTTKANYVMPNGPWNVKVEVGSCNWLMQPAVVTDWTFITYYTDTPPQDCRLIYGEGFYWDPITQGCVEMEEPSGSNPLVIGALLAGALVLFTSKK